MQYWWGLYPEMADASDVHEQWAPTKTEIETAEFSPSKLAPHIFEIELQFGLGYFPMRPKLLSRFRKVS